jgi:hypothetical protein
MVLLKVVNLATSRSYFSLAILYSENSPNSYVGVCYEEINTVNNLMREKEIESERDRERERRTDRQTDRPTDR